MILVAEQVQQRENSKFKEKAELLVPPFFLAYPSSGPKTLEGLFNRFKGIPATTASRGINYSEKSSNLEYQTCIILIETSYGAIKTIRQITVPFSNYR